jgi:hypothetical protein
MALEGAGSSYIFRTQIPPNLTPLSELRTLHPDSALVICENHLGQNDIVLKDDRIAKQPPSYPYHLVLRADGRVTRVHVNGIRRFFGRFEPHGVFGLMLIYPGEPGYERGK